MPLKRVLIFVSLFAAACASPKGDDGPIGPTGPTGPMGDPGISNPPSVSAVLPARVAIGVTTDVIITGFNTTWVTGATVSFGPGITVTNVRVGSPTGLAATIEVAPTTAVGTRDVTVTSGTEMTTFKMVFAVVARYDIKLIGSTNRGSFWSYQVRPNDPSISLGTELTASISPAPMMGEIAVAVASSTAPVVVAAHADFNATLGEYKVTLNTDDGPIDLPAFMLGDKVEQELLDGVPVTGALGANQTKLIKYTPAATPVPVVLHANGGLASRLVLHPLDADGNPLDDFTGSSAPQGPGNDILVSDAVAPVYYLLSETSGQAVNYTVNAVTMVEAIPEVEPNDDAASAQALTLATLAGDPAVRVTVATTSTDHDFFKITVSAADAGKRLHVHSFNNDYIYFDVSVTNSSNAVVMTSDDSSTTVDKYSSPLVAGDYVVDFKGDYTGDADIVFSLQ